MSLTKEEIKKAEEKAWKKANEIINKAFGKTPSADFMYYKNPKTKDMFCYTKSKIKHLKGEKYVAFIYRYRKTKNDWKLLKSSKVGFAKKKDAIRRAEKWYNESIEKVK